MKLSPKIIAKMPTKTLDQIRAKELALQKVRDAESFIAEFQDSFESSMAQDNEKGDDSPTDGVVSLSSETNEKDGAVFASTSRLATQLNNNKHYLSTELKVRNEPKDGYRGDYNSFATTRVMESDPSRNRVTFAVTTGSRRFNSLEHAKGYRVSSGHRPDRFLLVEGEGDDKTYRFEPLGNLQTAWESASDLAASLSRTFASLKTYLPEIEFKNSKKAD